MHMAMKKETLLSEKLIRKGLVTIKQLEIGLKEYNKRCQFLGTTLI